MFFACTVSFLRKSALAALATALLLGGAAGCVSSGGLQNLNAIGLHSRAQTAFDRGDYGAATEALGRLFAVFPEYPQAPEARFLFARAYQENGQYLLASDEYSRFLDRYPLHLLAPEAALGICRSYTELSPIPPRDQNYTRQAYGVCRDVAREYFAHSVAADAQILANRMRGRLAEKEYEAGQHYFRRNAFFSAIQYWDMLVEEFWDTEWAPRALLGISRAFERVGYKDDAEEYRLRLLNSYPDSEAAREVLGGNTGG